MAVDMNVEFFESGSNWYRAVAKMENPAPPYLTAISTFKKTYTFSTDSSRLGYRRARVTVKDIQGGDYVVQPPVNARSEIGFLGELRSHSNASQLGAALSSNQSLQAMAARAVNASEDSDIKGWARRLSSSVFR